MLTAPRQPPKPPASVSWNRIIEPGRSWVSAEGSRYPSEVWAGRRAFAAFVLSAWGCTLSQHGPPRQESSLGLCSCQTGHVAQAAAASSRLPDSLPARVLLPYTGCHHLALAAGRSDTYVAADHAGRRLSPAPVSPQSRRANCDVLDLRVSAALPGPAWQQ